MIKFSDLGLSEPLLKVLPELNINEPTQIQQKAIPVLIKNKEIDFLGLAQTGTGKTAAFGLPLLDAVDVNLHRTQALVLAPTRELGQQIAQQLKAFSKYLKGLRTQVVYGGASIVPQIKALKDTPHIVIATPGRLLDLINRRAVNLSNIRHVVFDEADEMLNMGFREDIDRILSFTEGEKSTWLFSATLAPELKKIVDKYMHNPEEVRIDSSNVVNQNIEHLYLSVNSRDKPEAIKRIIELEPDMRGIVFCRTKRDTQQLADQLQDKGLPVDAIHGDLSQNQRDQVMNRFKKHKLEFLIATDVAARGIDVNDLTHVVHYAMPDDLEYYTHRSGRTGRAGKTGISIALVNSNERRKIKYIEQKLKLNFKAYELPKAQDVQQRKLKEWADHLLNTDVDQNYIQNHLDDIHEQFQHINKEDLINKLMTIELKRLDIASSSTWESSRKEEVIKEIDPNKERYFINLGLIDGFNQKELIALISETCGVSKKVVQDVTVEEKKSYFTVEKEVVHLIAPAFNGLYFDDRQIRVNPDQGKQRSGRKRGQGGKSSRSGRYDRSSKGRKRGKKGKR